MFTLNSLLNALCESDKISFQGVHYQSGETVYAGDLWRIWPDPKGLESKRQDRLRDAMESKGMQLRFDDEVITDDNGKVHELQPGYHGQIATYKVFGDGTIWSQDEARDNADTYIEGLLNEEVASDRWLSDEQLIERGFIKFDYEAESGLHSGQTDTPQSVAARLKAVQPQAIDLIYQITDVGQFDAHYVVWYRLPEQEEGEEG
jgi:hypothetical protein